MVWVAAEVAVTGKGLKELQDGPGVTSDLELLPEIPVLPDL